MFPWPHLWHALPSRLHPHRCRPSPVQFGNRRDFTPGCRQRRQSIASREHRTHDGVLSIEFSFVCLGSERRILRIAEGDQGLSWLLHAPILPLLPKLGVDGGRHDHVHRLPFDQVLPIPSDRRAAFASTPRTSAANGRTCKGPSGTTSTRRALLESSSPQVESAVSYRCRAALHEARQIRGSQLRALDQAAEPLDFLSELGLADSRACRPARRRLP